MSSPAGAGGKRKGGGWAAKRKAKKAKNAAADAGGGGGGGGAPSSNNGAPNNVPVESSPEVLAMLATLSDGRGTLSDRLNPTHPCFQAEWKARYQALSKKGRAVIVAADAARLQTAADNDRWNTQMQRVQAARLAEFAKRQEEAAAARAPPTPQADADADSAENSAAEEAKGSPGYDGGGYDGGGADAEPSDPELRALNEKHPYRWIRPKRTGRASTIYLTRAADPPVEHGWGKQIDIDDEETQRQIGAFNALVHKHRVAPAQTMPHHDRR